MKNATPTIPILILCFFMGCTTTTPAPETSLIRSETKKEQSNTPVLSGQVRIDAGLTLPKGSKIFALWVVSETSPDYAYVYGRGTIDNKGFTLNLDAPKPPDEALNAAAVGVATLIAVPPTVTLPPNGRIAKTPFRAIYRQAIGVSSNHNLIYRTKDLGRISKLNWIDDFTPNRYQCGEGRPAKENQHSDYFVPVMCSEMVIRITKSRAVVNWT